MLKFFEKNRWMIFLIGFSLLLLRAWPRLFYPEVWGEDGTVNLVGFLHHGLFDVVNPQNGYLFLVPKLISITAASISFIQYPLISTVMAWCFIVAVFYILATAPLRIKGGIFLSIACFLIPSNPEVFGLPSYTFWWAALLLFVVIFWEEHSKTWRLRAGSIFLASLSSPLCLLTLPLFWCKAILFRKNRIHLYLALFATFCTALMVYVMLHSGSIQVASHFKFKIIKKIISQFFGFYLVGNIKPSWRFGCGMGLLIFYSGVLWVTRKSWAMWALVYLLIGTIFLSISRINFDIIHPIFAGPRYFFYPYLLQSWFLLQTWFIPSHPKLKYFGMVLLSLSIVNMLPAMGRHHDPLYWQNHVYSCAQFDEYNIPVHSAGNGAEPWRFILTNQACNAVLQRDLFYQKHLSDKTYPYQIIEQSLKEPISADHPEYNAHCDEGLHPEASKGAPKLVPCRVREMSRDARHDETNARHDETNARHGETNARHGETNARHGETNVQHDGVLEMHRNQRIWVRSFSRSLHITVKDTTQAYVDIPLQSSGWTLIEFSNHLLPDQFEVVFSDSDGHTFDIAR